MPAHTAIRAASASELAYVLVWLLAAWVVRKVWHAEFGWNSAPSLWIIAVGTAAAAACAAASSYRWVRG